MVQGYSDLAVHQIYHRGLGLFGNEVFTLVAVSGQTPPHHLEFLTVFDARTTEASGVAYRLGI